MSSTSKAVPSGSKGGVGETFQSHKGNIKVPHWNQQPARQLQMFYALQKTYHIDMGCQGNTLEPASVAS